MTGSEILKKLHDFEFPKRYAIQIDPEGKAFLQLKAKIDESFLPFIW